MSQSPAVAQNWVLRGSQIIEDKILMAALS